MQDIPSTEEEWDELAEVVSASGGNHPHHMAMDWHENIQDGDLKAKDATLEDKCAIIARIGILTLSAGAGGWRVRETMNRIARKLGVVCSAEMGLLTISLTCVDGTDRETLVVTLPKTGINTPRLWRMETFLKDLEACCADLTVRECHRLMDQIERDTSKGYKPWQYGLASGFACCAFTFLLGGGPIEMGCALVGAGLGHFVNKLIGAKRINTFACISVAVATACVSYLLALTLLGLIIPGAGTHIAGYIGAMLFVIPGFPLITSGLDIAQMDFKSGLERMAYALSIILVATLTGWLVATLVHLQPTEFDPQGLSPEMLFLLRLITSFVGVYGFSIMYTSPMKMAATAGLIGAVANTLRLTLVDASVAPEAAAFAGALAAGLLASAVRRKLTFPRLSLTVPSIVIMVPGLYMYRAMFYMATNDAMNSVSWLFRAAMIVIGLPIGLAVARILTDRHFRYIS